MASLSFVMSFHFMPILLQIYCFFSSLMLFPSYSPRLPISITSLYHHYYHLYLTSLSTLFSKTSFCYICICKIVSKWLLEKKLSSSLSSSLSNLTGSLMLNYVFFPCGGLRAIASLLVVGIVFFVFLLKILKSLVLIVL